MSKILINLMIRMSKISWFENQQTSYQRDRLQITWLRANMCASQALSKQRTILQLVEDIGVEPMTLCVQGRCSSQLS